MERNRVDGFFDRVWQDCGLVTCHVLRVRAERDWFNIVQHVVFELSVKHRLFEYRIVRTILIHWIVFPPELMLLYWLILKQILVLCKQQNLTLKVVKCVKERFVDLRMTLNRTGVSSTKIMKRYLTVDIDRDTLHCRGNSTALPNQRDLSGTLSRIKI